MNTQKTTQDLIQTLLKNRNITDKESQEKFLNPDFSRDIFDYRKMHDIDKAVSRIISAMKNNEKIIVYADYDADGIPGAVIFSDFFKKISYENFKVYIPHRHDEGYGLHIGAIKTFVKDKVGLVITIDLGVTAVDEIAYAYKHGLDILVTDHHEAGETLPNAFAIVNPKLGNYPDPMLCGAAVAWKVVCALLDALRVDDDFKDKVPPVGWEKWLLDMVGIATLSDMVPLLNENRALAWYGLVVLRKTNRVGLTALLRKMFIRKETLLEEDITFMITPRINAASRMAHPMDAFKLLASDDISDAQTRTEHLVKLNDERKKLVALTMREANKKLKERTIGDLIVIGNPDWQAGILGLVANKIADEHHCPVFVWSRENGQIKGSCRGGGVGDVHAIMMNAPEGTFIQSGGHKEAGGFSMNEGMVHELEERLLSVYTTPKVNNNNDMSFDAEMGLKDVSYATYNAVRKLAPFGVANEKPQFLFKNLLITDIRIFGKQKNHIELTFEQDNISVKALAFFSDEQSFSIPISMETVVSCIGHIEENTFGRDRSIRLRIVDIM